MTTQKETQLVDAKRLLELLFDEKSRPCLRWVRDRQKRREIPFVKVGRLCFFDPERVREHLLGKAR